eukprot:TRINITY_DN558_c0_g1_i1.p1 TRINITY_DN558_c0_g1~~TRINITY_DN558_c0_g1_i1.p1  ORF type:complete len:536 (-),score=19.61 TRINITY_DN558_c0_g1_i1:254-1861(-)
MDLIDYTAGTDRDVLERFFIDGGLPRRFVDSSIMILDENGFTKVEQLRSASRKQIEAMGLLPGAENICLNAVNTKDQIPRELQWTPLGKTIQFTAGEPFVIKLFSVVGGCPPYNFIWTKNYLSEICYEPILDQGVAADYCDAGWYTVSVVDAKGNTLTNEFYVQVVPPRGHEHSSLRPWQRIACWISDHKLAFEIDQMTLIVKFPLRPDIGVSASVAMPFSFPQGVAYMWEDKNVVMFPYTEHLIVSLKTRWFLLRGEFNELDTGVMEVILESQKVEFISGNRLDVLGKMKSHFYALSGEALPSEIPRNTRTDARLSSQGLFVVDKYLPSKVSTGPVGVALPSNGSTLLKADLVKSNLSNMAVTVVATGLIAAYRKYVLKEEDLEVKKDLVVSAAGSLVIGLAYQAGVDTLTTLAASGTGIVQIISNTALNHLQPLVVFAAFGLSAAFAVTSFARGKQTFDEMALQILADANTAACSLIGTNVGFAVGSACAGPLGAYGTPLGLKQKFDLTAKQNRSGLSSRWFLGRSRFELSCH